MSAITKYAVIGIRHDVYADIAAERQRQLDVEGWSPEHDDDEHKDGQLARAAACYANGGKVFELVGDGYPRHVWPWADTWWKPGDRRRDLIKAAALIVAEIERLDRAALSAEKESE